MWNQGTFLLTQDSAEDLEEWEEWEVAWAVASTDGEILDSITKA